MEEAQIRTVAPEEAEALTELTLRSKQYWGYDAEFMEIARPGLTISPEYIQEHTVLGLEKAGKLLGYYSVVDKGAGLVWLDNLFIAPEVIGQGYGQLLWQHALKTARQQGFQNLRLEAEPHAEGFYKRMGAIQIGEVPSGLIHVYPGRMLPLFEIAL